MAIPRTDDGIRDYTVNLYTQCNIHKAEWNIPEADLVTLKAYLDDYTAKLTAARSPDHRKSDILAKNEAKKALADYLPVFQGKNLDFNNAITKPVRESLGLTVKDTVKTPVERPQSAPRGWVEIRGPGILALHYKAAGAAGNGKPDGYFGALIRHGVFEPSDPAPQDSEGLPKVRIGTRPVEIFEYPPEMRGKKARFSIAWINDRGDIGPESEILEEFIP